MKRYKNNDMMVALNKKLEISKRPSPIHYPVKYIPSKCFKID